MTKSELEQEVRNLRQDVDAIAQVCTAYSTLLMPLVAHAKALGVIKAEDFEEALDHIIEAGETAGYSEAQMLEKFKAKQC